MGWLFQCKRNYLRIRDRREMLLKQLEHTAVDTWPCSRRARGSLGVGFDR